MPRINKAVLPRSCETFTGNRFAKRNLVENFDGVVSSVKIVAPAEMLEIKGDLKVEPSCLSSLNILSDPLRLPAFGLRSKSSLAAENLVSRNLGL